MASSDRSGFSTLSQHSLNAKTEELKDAGSKPYASKARPEDAEIRWFAASQRMYSEVKTNIHMTSTKCQ
jgi:hypothetical protein